MSEQPGAYSLYPTDSERRRAKREQASALFKPHREPLTLNVGIPGYTETVLAITAIFTFATEVIRGQSLEFRERQWNELEKNVLEPLRQATQKLRQP